MDSSIKILYEDSHLLAVDKPVGIASVPAEYIPESKTIQGMVRRWADLNEKGFKPYLLHRLDKNTSGLILFGKHEHDRKKLENILRQEDTKKTYLALVKGVPRFEESTIKIPLDARTANIKVPALTHYKIIKKFGPTSLLEVVIETGRKHQIRKHLAMIKNPLVLDPEYGDRLFNNNYQRKLKGKGQFFLRAWKIEFTHPFTKEKVIIKGNSTLQGLDLLNTF
jgi:23S rRNA pseudouridine955/2504/2580 synthase